VLQQFIKIETISLCGFPKKEKCIFNFVKIRYNLETGKYYQKGKKYFIPLSITKPLPIYVGEGSFIYMN
jgi:hypothetical protein